MTTREAAVIMAQTGIVMLTGSNLKHYYKYLEEIMGHPVYSHEIPYLEKIIKRKSFKDFVEICKNIEEDKQCF